MRLIRTLVVLTAVLLGTAAGAHAYNINIYTSVSGRPSSVECNVYVYRDWGEYQFDDVCSDTANHIGRDMPWFWATYPMKLVITEYAESGRYKVTAASGNGGDILGNLMDGYNSANQRYTTGIDLHTGNHSLSVGYSQAWETINLTVSGCDSSLPQPYFHNTTYGADNYRSGNSIVTTANWVNTTTGNLYIPQYVDNGKYKLVSATGTGDLAGKNLMNTISGSYYVSEALSLSTGNTSSSLTLTYQLQTATINLTVSGMLSSLLDAFYADAANNVDVKSGTTITVVTNNSSEQGRLYFKKLIVDGADTYDLVSAGSGSGFLSGATDSGSSTTYPGYDYFGLFTVAEGQTGSATLAYAKRQVATINVTVEGMPQNLVDAMYTQNSQAATAYPANSSGAIAATLTAPSESGVFYAKDTVVASDKRYELVSFKDGTGFLAGKTIAGTSTWRAGYKYCYTGTVTSGDSANITLVYKGVADVTQNWQGITRPQTVTAFDTMTTVAISTEQVVTENGKEYGCSGWTNGTGSIAFEGYTSACSFTHTQHSNVTWTYEGPKAVTVDVAGLPQNLLDANAGLFTPAVGTGDKTYGIQVDFFAPLIEDKVNECFYKVKSFTGTGQVPEYQKGASQYTIARINQPSSITWYYEKVFQLKVGIDGVSASLVDPKAVVDNVEYDVIGSDVYFKENSNVTLTALLRKFARPDINTGDSPNYSAAADFDGDGYPDLAVSNYGDDTVSVFIGNGDGGFQPKLDYAAGDGPMELAAADFDGDGYIDIAVDSRLTDKVVVYFGSGDGTFAAGAGFTAGDGPWGLTTADFDGDGYPDLACSNENTDTVSVLKNNGDRTFTKQADMAAGDWPINLVAADINNDNKPDLLVPNHISNTVSIYMGNGDGTFQPKTDIAAGAAPHHIAVGDFDSDGKPDMAVANRSGYSVSVFPGNGDGTFGAKTDYPSGSGPVYVNAFDLDGDGALDLAAINVDSDRASVLYGNGDGTFGEAVYYTVGDFPRCLVAADFNVDGRPDLAASNFRSDTVSILLGTGTGGLETDSTYASGLDPLGAAVADLDGDTFPDLVVADYSSGKVSVMLGYGDGTFKDKADYTAGSSPNGVNVEDYNGDGAPDLAVVNYWGGTVSMFMGDKDPSTGKVTGAFGPKTDFGIGSRPVESVTADFNGDGKLDIAASNWDKAVTVLFGKGDGTFQETSTVTSFASYVRYITAGDFNKDGSQDIAVTEPNVNKMAVMLGNGNGTFKAPVEYATGNYPYGIATGDFNSDGRVDLVVTNFSSASISLYTGKGNGTFQPKTDYPVGSTPRYAVVRDMNKDGTDDIVVVNSVSKDVSVLICNGDGTFQDRTDYPTGAADPRYVAAGDFNGDGQADLAVPDFGGDVMKIMLGGRSTFEDNFMNMVCLGSELVYGSATPSAELLVGDRMNLPVNLTRNTYVVWKYRGARRWEIGKPVSPPVVVDEGIAPAYKILVRASAGDTEDNSFFWAGFGKKTYPVREVPVAIISWTNAATGEEMKVPGFTVWPDKIQRHISGVPVNLQPSTNPYIFGGVKYTSCNAQVNNGVFSADQPGRSVLMFVDGPSSETSRYPVGRFVVVDSYDWPDLVTDMPWTIGSAITDTSHNDPEGKNGHVYFESAYYDGNPANPNRAYDRATRTGNIIPVNKNVPYSQARQMVVVWFDEDGYGVGWPASPVRYLCDWPSGPDKIVIASGDGAGTLPADQKTGQVYYQNEKTDGSGKEIPGYNPNEEHALMLGSTVYALRNDLNNKPAGTTTSEPYVLLKYKDSVTKKWNMRVFKVEADNTFSRQNEVGSPITAPTPLDLLLADAPDGASGGGEWCFVDHKGGLWAKAAKPVSDPPDPAVISIKWRYPLQKGFYYPYTHDNDDNPIVEGTPVPFLNGGASHEDPAVDVSYATHWPDSAPVLTIGETLTSAKYGLPDVVNMAAAKVVFDENVYNGGGPMARLYDPYTTRSVSVPNGIPSGINTETSGGVATFPDLPFALKSRLGYDPVNKVLSFAGTVYDSGIGEPLTLSNVMTKAEKEYLQTIDQDDNVTWTDSTPPADKIAAIKGLANWDQVIEYLYMVTRDPNGSYESMVMNSVNECRNPYNSGNEDDMLSTLGKWGIGLSLARSPNILRDRMTGVLWIDILRNGSTWVEAKEKDSSRLIFEVNLNGTWYDAKWQTSWFVDANGRVWEWYIDKNRDGKFTINFGTQGIYTTSESARSLIPGTLSVTPVQVQPVAGSIDSVAFLSTDELAGVPMALSAGAASGKGYLVLAENDDDSLGDAPVALHIMKVGGGPYVGEVKVIDSDSVFDEKLTMRHTGDFGGEPDKFYYVWYYQPDKNGIPPQLPEDPSDTDGWIVADEGYGKLDTTIKGASKQTLSDNWYMVHYYYKDKYPTLTTPSNPLNAAAPKDDLNNWSGWAGAPGGETAQLAEGWLKRVTAKLNPLDARVSDFRNNATNTNVSIISQIGERFEGEIALNGSADNLNGVGLIEAYQTLLERAMDFSINNGDDYGPANVALLNVATRLADFYAYLGNEAYADAVDPTIGFGTNSTQYGNLAPTMFAFQNQAPSLLDEELCLLRGRDDSLSTTKAAPVYNRMVWNFTDGDGEAAYVQNYNVSDGDGDGFINELDAKAGFPQGHGDAWGQYLNAMSFYYTLMNHPNFTWEPRVESVLVGGAPVPVDYEDERKFAELAAQKARTGADVVDLTYRKSYVDDPAGQWQGYKDTDTERAWGMDGWARRAGQGAYFDWVVANAILPAEDPDASHTGIQKIDRTTVKELADIASQYAQIQSETDAADKGLNPLGLAKGVVPFDIDPSLLTPTAGISPKTHFEQIYDRAMEAMDNAITVFDYANSFTLMLRQEDDNLFTFNRGIQEQERDYTNRLIEVFGYPYAGDIGAGKTYSDGYDGPDIFHYMYVNVPDLTGMGYSPAITGYTASFDFSNRDLDPELGVTESTKQVQYFISEDTPWLTRPDSWGDRRAPGEVQQALGELIKTHADFKRAQTELDLLVDDIDYARERLENKYSVLDDKLDVMDWNLGWQQTYNAWRSGLNVAQKVTARAKERVEWVAEAAKESLPKTVGFSPDVFAPVRGMITGTTAIIGTSMGVAEDIAAIAEYSLDNQKEETSMKAERKIAVADGREEVRQLVMEMEDTASEAAAKQQELYMLKEVIEQAIGNFQAALARGERLIDEREQFRKNTAADIQDWRYQDLAFRIFRNDALQKYRAQFDLAARYVYLAATAYDYETNLLGPDNGSGRQFLTDIVRQRSLGQMLDGSPVAGRPGLADPLARLSQNFGVYKTQLGFNNPQTETNRFSLRSELCRLKDSSDEAWRDQLRGYVVPDLWKITEFKRFCKPFAPESIGAQPGMVIPFSTKVIFGENFFGWPLSGGDSSYDPTNFATKIRSVGVWFKNYNGTGLSNTPRVYLVPVGADVLRSPSGDGFDIREWHVVDQKLPVPFPIGATDLADPAWIPMNDSLSGTMADIRRFSSFRAYHDSGTFTTAETVSDSRLIGRSVWNTKWMLIIPGGTLLYNADQGLDTFIDTVGDIKIFFQTYAYSGN